MAGVTIVIGEKILSLLSVSMRFSLGSNSFAQLKCSRRYAMGFRLAISSTSLVETSAILRERTCLQSYEIYPQHPVVESVSSRIRVFN